MIYFTYEISFSLSSNSYFAAFSTLFFLIAFCQVWYYVTEHAVCPLPLQKMIFLLNHRVIFHEGWMLMLKSSFRQISFLLLLDLSHHWFQHFHWKWQDFNFEEGYLLMMVQRSFDCRQYFYNETSIYTTTKPPNKKAFSTSDHEREARRKKRDLIWKGWKSLDHVKRNTKFGMYRKRWEYPETNTTRHVHDNTQPLLQEDASSFQPIRRIEVRVLSNQPLRIDLQRVTSTDIPFIQSESDTIICPIRVRHISESNQWLDTRRVSHIRWWASIPFRQTFLMSIAQLTALVQGPTNWTLSSLKTEETDASIFLRILEFTRRDLYLVFCPSSFFPD